jgi:hypothetical protein
MSTQVCITEVRKVSGHLCDRGIEFATILIHFVIVFGIISSVVFFYFFYLITFKVI